MRHGDPSIVACSERSCPAETIETANGNVICSAKVDVDVAGLGRIFGAMVLLDGRNLLCLDRLTQDLGMKHSIGHPAGPSSTWPNGKEVQLVHNQRVASIAPPRAQASANASSSEHADDVIEVFAKSLLAEAYAEASVPTGGASSGSLAPPRHFGQELLAFSAEEAEPDAPVTW